MSSGTLTEPPWIGLFPAVEGVGGIGTELLCAELVPLGITVAVVTGVFVVDVVEGAFGPDAWSGATVCGGRRGGGGGAAGGIGAGRRGIAGGGGLRGLGLDFNPEFIILIERIENINWGGGLTVLKFTKGT